MKTPHKVPSATQLQPVRTAPAVKSDSLLLDIVAAMNIQSVRFDFRLEKFGLLHSIPSVVYLRAEDLRDEICFSREPVVHAPRRSYAVDFDLSCTIDEISSGFLQKLQDEVAAQIADYGYPVRAVSDMGELFSRSLTVTNQNSIRMAARFALIEDEMTLH